MFPAHFRHQEEGIIHISRMTRLEEARDEAEEMKLSEEEDSRTMRINKNLPEHLKEELLHLFREYKDVFTWLALN